MGRRRTPLCRLFFRLHPTDRVAGAVPCGNPACTDGFLRAAVCRGAACLSGIEGEDCGHRRTPVPDGDFPPAFIEGHPDRWFARHRRPGWILRRNHMAPDVSAHGKKTLGVGFGRLSRRVDRRLIRGLSRRRFSWRIASGGVWSFPCVCAGRGALSYSRTR